MAGKRQRHERTAPRAREIELARLAVFQVVTRVLTGASAMAIGGVVALGGFRVVLAAAVLGLDLVLRTTCCPS